MSQIIIDIGDAPDDGLGTPLRQAFSDINTMFSEVYAAGPAASNVVIANNTISTKAINSNLILSPSGIGKIQVNNTIFPSIDDVYDLGNPTKRFNTLYLGTGGFDSVGNITGNFFIGNGRFLSGVLSTPGPFIIYGNTSVAIPTLDGNVLFTINGNLVSTISSNVANFVIPIQTNQSVTAPYFYGNVVGNISGNVSAPGNNQQVVFNDNGVLGASSGFTFSKVGNVLTIAGNALIGNNAIISNNAIVTGNANIAGNLSVTQRANVQGDMVVQGNTNSYGNIYAYQDAEVFGNIIADQNLQVLANISTGNILAENTLRANVLTVLGNGNVVGSFQVGQITGTAGISVVGNVAGNNATLTGLASVAGNVTAANVNATGNLTGVNLNLTNQISATGNILAANAALGNISVAGNVQASYYFGNGAFLSNIETSIISNGTSNVQIATANGNVNIAVANTPNIAVFSTTGEYVTGVVSATGNIIGANLTTAGLVSATGNVLGGNVNSVGVVSAAGNVIGANLSTSGNVSAVNVNTSGIVSASGTVIGANISTSGNVSAVNVNTTGIVSASGNIISNANIAGNFVSPGANREILFNDNGLIRSNSNITFDKAGPTLSLNVPGGTIITGYVSSLGGTDLSLTPATNNVVFWGNGNPRFSNTWQLGTSSFQWKNVWAGNANIGTLGVTTLSATGNVVGGNLVTAGLVDTGTLSVAGNATVNGNLIVNGNTIYVNVTNLNVSDPIIGIGRGVNNTPLVANDGKDRGEQLWYYAGSEKSAFIGYDDSAGNLIAATDVTIASEVVTVNNYGNFTLGNISVATVTSNANISGVNVSASGNVTAQQLIGNVVTTNIDSADSSQITVVPDTNFLASVDVDQDLFVNNQIQAGTISATGIITAEKYIGTVPGSTNYIYVAKNGSDSNNGTLNSPLATIKEALSRATAGTSVQLAPGTYLEDNPLTIPANVALIGDNLRTCTIVPKNPNSDVFYVRNASYVWGITLRDYLANGFAYDPATPTQNVFVSPYIQNLTSYTTTGTAVKIDGSLTSANSTKAMIVGFFTIINRGGKGIHLVNQAYSQLVNIYTIACDVGIKVESGSFCTLNGSDCSIGNYGLWADGKGNLQTAGTTVGYSTQGIFRLNNLSNGRPHVNTVMQIAGDPEYYTIDNIIPIDNATCDVYVQQTYTANLAPNTNVSFYVRSAIIASAHTFEYVGAGTNPATALPQYGGLPIEANEVIQLNGGVVTFTSTDQKGNFKVGSGFIINQAQGTIQGDYFYKALFAQMTPYILALQQ